MRLGWRLTGGAGDGPSFSELSFEARRRESANDDSRAEHEVREQITARFWAPDGCR